STTAKKMEIISVNTITTVVDPTVSCLLGKVTFASSFFTSLKKSVRDWIKRFIRFTVSAIYDRSLSYSFAVIYVGSATNRRDKISDFNLAGQEGFEPPACGFGDRRSNQLELLAYKMGAPNH